MAQHIPIDVYPQKAMKKLAEGIRRRKEFDGSLIWEPLPDDYKESPDDKVYFGYRNVPPSIVHGGRAGIEVHTEPIPGRLNYFRNVTKIYLVA